MTRNTEIKARIHAVDEVLAKAKEISGTDGVIIDQVDTFFNAPNGRLKLRKILGQYEELIFYNRPDTSGPKISEYKKVERPIGSLSGDMKELLSEALGVRGEVVKRRTLYIVDQTRIHIDRVEKLGDFMELEVMLRDDQTLEDGETIARSLMEKLDIKDTDLVQGAYIDLLSS